MLHLLFDSADGVLTSIKFHIDLLFHYICLMCDRL